MATAPKPCPRDANDGFLFDRDALVLEEGEKSIEMMDLSDYFADVSSYAKTRYKLKGGSSFILAQSDMGDADGYVSFIAFKTIFPEGTTTVNKYLNWTYNSNTNPMGEIMILTGKRVDSEVEDTIGWNLSYGGGITGGIIIENPHTDLVAEIEILIAR